MAHLMKYLELQGRYAPVNEAADIFGLKGIRLGGLLFDETNLATKAEIVSLNALLAALDAAFNAHASQQVVDLNELRVEIAALYGLARALAADIQTVYLDGPDEEEVVATAGQTIVASTYLKWSPNEGIADIEVYRNGIHLTQDLAGGTDRDFRKISETEIEIFRPLLVDDRISFRSARSISNSIAWPYFFDFVTSREGRAIPTPARYRVGLDMLAVFRNGALLVNSTSVGQPSDRYEESSMTYVTLGMPAVASEFFAFLNRAIAPDYRFVQTGVSGTVLTVPDYTVGTGRLLVWRNGVLLNDGGFGLGMERYEETSTTEVTLGSAATVDDVFVIEHLAAAPAFRSLSAAENGGTITLPSPYVPGDGRLQVFRNGILMVNSATAGTPADRYQEASSTTITLSSPASVGEVFTFIYG